MYRFFNWQKNILIISILLILLVCKKKDSYNSSSILSAGSWHYVNYEKRHVSAGIAGVWVSKLDSLDPCIKDNITTFKSDYSFELNESTIPCSSGAPQIKQSGTWFIKSDTLVLELINTGLPSYSEIYKITNLSNQTLQLVNASLVPSYLINVGSPPDYEEIRWTYAH